MRLIDADALAANLIAKGFYPALVKRAIENATTIDAVPVVYGRWVQGYEIKEGFFEENMEIPYVECSCCGFVGWHLDIEDIGTVDFKLNYCPSCGAKMNKEANHEPI